MLIERLNGPVDKLSSPTPPLQTHERDLVCLSHADPLGISGDEPSQLHSFDPDADTSMSPAPMPTAMQSNRDIMRSEPNGQKGTGTLPAKTKERQAAPVGLRQVEHLFADCAWPERRVFVRARKRARARALEALQGADPGVDVTRIALLIAATELFSALRVELVARPGDLARLAEQLEKLSGLSRFALAREVLRTPELLTLPPTVAVELQISTLVTFAPLRSASLWTLDHAERVACMRHVGDGGPSRGAKQLAQAVLTGQPTESSPRRLLLGLAVGRWQQPLAALVGSARPGVRDGCASFLAEAVPMLGAILERDALLAGSAASERALVESSERKLTRLGFDLHDGPIQGIAVLAEDLRLFGDQLETLLRNPKQRKLARGRMEDLDAQLMALDVELRRLSSDVHAPALLNRPFTRALRDVTHAFAARTNIEPRLALHGELGLLSVSQQIALLNIIHEALANIREHSDATEVEIAVSAGAKGIEARVADNGHGFDLEPTLSRAARDGRLGLVAMHERVRLLGGQCRIDSRRGGPTVISVSLERWEPLVNETPGHRASA